MKGIAADLRPRWRRRLDRALRDPWGIVMDGVGDRTVGSHSVPTTWRMGKIRGRGKSENRTLGVRTDNDASGVMGWWYYDDDPNPDHASVAFAFNRSEARQVAWWILRWWAADWFGLRRWLYYLALHRHLAAYDRHRWEGRQR